MERLLLGDDVLPTSVTVLASIELSLQGLMIWGQSKQTQEWVEPFFSTVRVADAGNEVLVYRMLCGDSALGLGKVPYLARKNRGDQALPEEWMFIFSGK
jgi:hypothetical protein